MTGTAQAFACAVEEEVAFAAITSYYMTIFIGRSLDVREKSIYTSGLVWSDQRQPSAGICWLNFLLEVQQGPQGAVSVSTVKGNCLLLHQQSCTIFDR